MNMHTHSTDELIAELAPLLNAATMDERIAHLQDAVRSNWYGIRDAAVSEEANNHVHTFYSFSPYSPTFAAFMARWSGLQVVGSIDHDSISAAPEMVEACKIVGVASTVGAEVRTTWYNTPFADRKINSPDAPGIAYVVIHGAPRRSWKALDEYLAPIRAARNERNRGQLDALNSLLNGVGLEPLNFNEDIVPLSQSVDGGSVTERHLAFAVAQRLLKRFGRGAELVRVLRRHLDLEVGGTVEERLLDEENPHYPYDLLGVLKSGLVPYIFILPGEEECRPIAEVVATARQMGAIPAYAYLGDVTESPTGDKKAERFEDGFLDELFDVITELGFQAVTYMPPRNTKSQLRRVQDLCRSHGLMEISGVDINSSRQPFTCPEVLEPEFRHLN
ncbi:MAG: PHP domain-containing protein, partial [Spirochaetota bacterium]